MKLYVGNLAYSMTETELNEMFAPYGTINSAAIVNDRDSGQSKGFAFVEMSTRGEGHKAMEDLNGKMINNRALVVNEAKPPVKNKSRRW
ncbi:MAG TPA: RNA-binding protein [Desulfurivibrio alkaliphilus]|uniref:RNA-binding protein n=1 Tax=Desulfurivibrio alkaliphilus TaxID=427923 RepID=A0A7C2XLF6_9BACT|nr:RNA-binding protein [Desulfurivibrio alkaliphilus]